MENQQTQTQKTKKMEWNSLAKCWIQGMNQYLEYTGSYEVIYFPIQDLSELRKVLIRMPIAEDELDCYPCIGLDNAFWVRRLNNSLYFCEVSKKYGDINFILKVIEDSLDILSD